MSETIPGKIEPATGHVLTIESVGDRYTHRFMEANHHQPDLGLPLMKAIEGSDTDDWPPSPPLQDYSIEQREQGQVLLAVGMAGKSHWSASVTHDSASGEFEFDIACRAKEAFEFLGSTYELTGKIAEVMDAENGLQVKIGVVGDEARKVGFSITTVDGRVEFDAGLNQVRILPSAAPSSQTPFPATIRWRYQITFSAAIS